jgi:hypothetical protein
VIDSAKDLFYRFAHIFPYIVLIRTFNTVLAYLLPQDRSSPTSYPSECSICGRPGLDRYGDTFLAFAGEAMHFLQDWRL